MSSGFVPGGTILEDKNGTLAESTTTTATDAKREPLLRRRMSSNHDNGTRKLSTNIEGFPQGGNSSTVGDDGDASDEGRLYGKGDGDHTEGGEDEWKRVKSELEQTRRDQQAKRLQQQQQPEKSLYEILQANKQAKQEAFEESIRLKNQFRALDEDEVDFLDSLLESTRAKEAAVKKETEEQLAVFYRQRELADKSASAIGDVLGVQNAPGELPAEEENWSLSTKKRKRGNTKRESLLITRKLTKSSSAASMPAIGLPHDSNMGADTNMNACAEPNGHEGNDGSSESTSASPSTFTSMETTAKVAQGMEDTLKQAQPAPAVTKIPAQNSLKKPPGPSLGLVGYGSDGDSD